MQFYIVIAGLYLGALELLCDQQDELAEANIDRDAWKERAEEAEWKSEYQEECFSHRSCRRDD